MMLSSGLASAKQFRQRIRVSPLLVVITGLILPAASWSQVTYTGTAPTQNFGSVAVGSTSAAKTFSFSVPAGTTVGSIGVLTTGVANLDFTSASGGTCSAQTYASAATCTVNVTFKPKAPGVRMGAVVFFSGASDAGTMLGSVLIYGTGSGPQIAFSPVSPSYAWMGANGVTVDDLGNLFFLALDQHSLGHVYMLPAGGGTATDVYPLSGDGPLEQPSCMVVDGAGNWFIGDDVPRVVKVPVGGGTATAITPVVDGIAMGYPDSLAIDGAGDLYIGDSLNDRVIEVPAGGGTPIAIAPTVGGIPLDGPNGLAVDAAGDLFIVDQPEDRVLEVPPNGGTVTEITPTVNGVGLGNPAGIAIDGAGDLFIGDGENQRIVEVPANGGAAIAFSPMMPNGTEIYETVAVAVDPSGDLYILAQTFEGDSNNLWELPRSLPPALNFPTETAPGSTDTTDGTKTVQIQNIGNAPLILTALSYPADFSEAAGDSNACGPSSGLSAGQQCDLPIEFTPVGFGLLTESVKLTDDVLNVSGATQSIQVTGVAGAPAAITSPTPGSTLTGPTATFTWTTSPTGSEYFLTVGTGGPGANNLFNLGYRTVTSWIVTGLPTNGETIYARLYTKFNGTLSYNDYTFTAFAAAAATLTSPAPGSTLTYASIPFTWTSMPGATSYNLEVGSTGVGSNNLFNMGYRDVTSWTVTGLPKTNETIYVRLFTDFNGAIVSKDYTFTNGGTAAALTSPAAGSTLGGPVTFTWTPGAGVTEYDLIVGIAGPGSGDLLNSGAITATSATVNIPAWGGTVYVRLMSEIGGAWQFTDYTFTEQ